MYYSRLQSYGGFSNNSLSEIFTLFPCISLHFIAVIKTAEKPRWDNWHVRLPNLKDQQRAIDLFQRSGAETKSDFVRSRILGESFKVITVDKSAVKYYRKLSELTAQIHKIGVLYNQTVRAINSYHSIKTAQIMLEKLEKLSDQIITLQEQAINLTIDYRKR